MSREPVDIPDELVARAMTGDRTAIGALIAAIRPLVVRYCRARLGRFDRSSVSAADVAQEVCLAVLTALPGYRVQGRPFLACAYGRIGASPDGGMTYFLPRIVGPSRALELLLEDPNITPQQALEEKLVSEVVPADELMDAARAKAEKLAEKAPYYVRKAKELTGVSIENGITEHLQLERHGIADSMATEDLRIGVEAFFGGKKAEFVGR